MATKRDHVWSAALELAREAELDEDGPTGRYSFPGVTVEHVLDRLDGRDVDVARRTVRDTLNGMNEVGALAKRDGGGRSYAEYRLPRDHPFRS